MSSRTRDYADRHPRNRRKPAGGGGARGRGPTAPRGGGSARSGLPAWAWMVVGLSAGLLVAVFVYISRPAEPMAMAPSSDQGRPEAAIELPPKEPSRFAFYEMLPSYEVVVSDEVLNAPPPPKPRSPPPRPAETVATATPTPAEPPAIAQPVSPPPAATPLPGGPRASGAEQIAVLKAAVAAEERERKARPAAAKPTVAEPLPKPAASAASRERWLIQVAAYRSRADADQQRAGLALLGLSAAVEQVTIDQRETWYRVRVGPYGDAAAAQSAQRTLQAQGLKGVVMKIKS